MYTASEKRIRATHLFVYMVFLASPSGFADGGETQKPGFGEGAHPGEVRVLDLGNDIVMRFVWCPAGDFVMGSPIGEPGRDEDERQHRVTLSRGFWLGQHEVTQRQWELVMGNNPSTFKGPRNPVNNVSWNNCQAFILKLNERAGISSRLPTEAEWEYACRAGTNTAYTFGSSLDILNAYAWTKANSGGTTHPVGEKQANAWSLHDMHGNVWEWCGDWHGTYPSGAVTDPKGPDSGPNRVHRGGSWGSIPRRGRSAYRFLKLPEYRDKSVGFRLLVRADR